MAIEVGQVAAEHVFAVLRNIEDRTTEVDLEEVWERAVSNVLGRELRVLIDELLPG